MGLVLTTSRFSRSRSPPSRITDEYKCRNYHFGSAFLFPAPTTRLSLAWTIAADPRGFRACAPFLSLLPYQHLAHAPPFSISLPLLCSLALALLQSMQHGTGLGLVHRRSRTRSASPPPLIPSMPPQLPHAPNNAAVSVPVAGDRPSPATSSASLTTTSLPSIRNLRLSPDQPPRLLVQTSPHPSTRPAPVYTVLSSSSSSSVGLMRAGDRDRTTGKEVAGEGRLSSNVRVRVSGSEYSPCSHLSMII